MHPNLPCPHNAAMSAIEWWRTPTAMASGGHSSPPGRCDLSAVIELAEAGLTLHAALRALSKSDPMFEWEWTEHACDLQEEITDHAGERGAHIAGRRCSAWRSNICCEATAGRRARPVPAGAARDPATLLTTCSQNYTVDKTAPPDLPHPPPPQSKTPTRRSLPSC